MTVIAVMAPPAIDAVAVAVPPPEKAIVGGVVKPVPPAKIVTAPSGAPAWGPR